MAVRENLPIPADPDFSAEIGGLNQDDPVHYAQMNAILTRLLTNDVFLEKLASKMVEKTLIAHVLDRTNTSMVLGADQAPALTALLDTERERITKLNSDLTVLNTKITQKFQSEFYAIADVTGVSTGQVTDGYHNVSKMSNGQFRYSAHFTCYPSAIPNGNIVGYLPESANPYQIVYEYTYDITNQKWVRIRIGNNDRSIQLMNLDGTNVTSQRVELEYHIDF